MRRLLAAARSPKPRAFVFGVLLFVPVLASCNALAVTDLYASLDSDGARKKSEFTADAKAVYCVAEVSSGRDDGSILVLVRQTKLATGADANRVLAATEGVSSPGSTRGTYSAQLVATNDKGEKSDELPLPAGKFRCEVFLDSGKEPVRQSEFLIKPSACPIMQIQQGTPCAGFFEENRQCPRYGASSKEPDVCTCSGPTWSC
ncbi:MAG: hypothetical protein U0174_05750 [Polyangiaceae bacterium]